MRKKVKSILKNTVDIRKKKKSTGVFQVILLTAQQSQKEMYHQAFLVIYKLGAILAKQRGENNE
jgi:hypothetical protein